MLLYPHPQGVDEYKSRLLLTSRTAKKSLFLQAIHREENGLAVIRLRLVASVFVTEIVIIPLLKGKPVSKNEKGVGANLLQITDIPDESFQDKTILDEFLQNTEFAKRFVERFSIEQH